MADKKALDKIKKKIAKIGEHRKEMNDIAENEWYSIRHINSYFNFALFAILLGGREAGKSYSVTDFFCRQFVNKGIPFTWIRLTEAASKKLLKNNAEKLIDPDLRRKYNLDIVTSGNNVYNVKRVVEEKKKKDGSTEYKSKVVEKVLIARVYALSTFYNDKGSIYDKDFLNDLGMRYNVAIDEFQRESGERNTFDILYGLVNQLENLLRSTKTRTKVFFLGNCLEDASEILCAFNFIPEQFGIYKLVKNKKILIQYLKELDAATTDKEKFKVNKKYRDYDFGKRCIIEYIEPSDAYKTRRKGTIADILMPKASTFTNQINTDNTLINKSRLIAPNYVIKFTKNPKDWFTVWNDNIINQYHNEKKQVIAMRPYLDEVFSADTQKKMITLFDTRSFQYRNLITFKQFQTQMELLIPRK